MSVYTKAFFSFTCLVVFVYYYSIAQDTSTIKCKGTVVDATGEFISYVNISVKSDPSIGVYSGNSGRFEIKLPHNLIQDSLLFSCIGYEDRLLPIFLFKSDSLKVILTTKTYFLDEVLIKSDSAKNIVRKSILNLSKTLPRHRTILQGFFREIVRSDYTYDRLIEAAVDVLDIGYQHAQEKNRGLVFKVRELRRSEDYMDLDWKASILNYLNPKNGLHGKDVDALFNHDYIRNNADQFFELFNAPLNEKLLSFVDFSIDSLITFKNDTLFCIGISPSSDTDYFLPHGHLYIRYGDYAIFEMEFQMNVNDQNTRTSLQVPDKKYLFKTLIKYVDYQGDMYLGMLRREAFRQQLNYTKSSRSNGREGAFYDEKTFIVNEIITEKNKLSTFKRKDRQNDEVDLYDEDWKYNEPFWMKYTILHDNPLSPSIRTDLERIRTLEEQFRKDE
jgi:hypothetical protein